MPDPSQKMAERVDYERTAGRRAEWGYAVSTVVLRLVRARCHTGLSAGRNIPARAVELPAPQLRPHSRTWSPGHHRSRRSAIDSSPLLNRRRDWDGRPQEQARDVSRALVVQMGVRPCPNCQTETPRLLYDTSQFASVWYYRCDKCGHVWHVLKSDPDGPTSDVTLPPNK